jgi:mono/diheme cytochrome c family protein
MDGQTSIGAGVRRGLLAMAALSVLATGGVAIIAAGQGPRPQQPALVPESLVGSVSFDLYCASCHGRSGRGDGPTASSLRTRPADLTTLARRNKGVFPRDRVLAFIEGSNRTAAHGSRDMPVWGPTLRALDASDARVTVRLQNLVAFVESIQQAPDVAAPTRTTLDGETLFRTYCASCHGSTGRGDGPMAGELRRMPPSLTTFASRNGGVFPTERVRQIIDGTGPMAHGDRSMPVWGDVFKRTGDGHAGAAVRIDAIVQFLQGLQERRAE